MIATDIKGFQIVLGIPWLQQVNPEIDWFCRQWRYRRASETHALDVGALSVEECTLGTMFADAGVAKIFAVVVLPTLSPRKLGAGATLASNTVDEPEIPNEIADLSDVFSEHSLGPVSEATQVTHSIDILEGTEPPYGPIYPLSQHELEVLRAYLDTALEKGWIRRSESSAGAPILFVQKKDGGLRLCVDYRALNKLTTKNRYPLPLIPEILDRLSGAKYFTKLDLKDAYYRIRIKAGDEWKTAFRTRYGHYEYMVMPFGLTNAPATFQAHINEVLRGLLDLICVAYLDDIMIFSRTYEEHVSHVRQVLVRLRKYGLIAKLSKCEFFRQEVDFLGYHVSVAGVSMDPSRVEAIQEWPVPKSFRDIQVFLGFANFYRGFIYRYSAVVAPITDLLKGMKNGKKTGPFEWTEDANNAFRALKACFSTAPMVAHFEYERPSKVEVDASGSGLGGILSQAWEAQGESTRLVWKPVAFYSRKMNQAERNYGVGDQEMLAIITAFKTWRHYLECASHTIRVLTDHQALTSFMTTKNLNRRQARWGELLALYDFVLEWRKGKDNPADGLSRRPDYDMRDAGEDHALTELLRSRMPNMFPNLPQNDAAILRLIVEPRAREHDHENRWCILGRLTAEASDEGYVLPSEGRRNLCVTHAQAPLDPDAGNPQEESKIPHVAASTILALQKHDAFCQERGWEKYTDGEITEPGTFTGKWSIDAEGLVRHAGAVYVPHDERTIHDILRVNHDDPWQGGHFGLNRTLDLIRRFYWWPKMQKDVREYCDTCDICQRMKVPRHKPYGLLQPLPKPERPWQDISLDFIVGLPPSRNRGVAYDAVLVVVDRFSKMVRYLPTTVTIDSPGLAELLISACFSQYGTPRSIVSDRGTTFTSGYWSTFCYYLAIRRCLSTAFHPQTDGQTERANQTLESYLRCYINWQQDDWATLLPAAEYAANNARNATTGKSPFEVVYRFSPSLGVNPGNEPLQSENDSARAQANRLDNALEENAQLWEAARNSMEKYYNRKRKELHFKPGDKVRVATKNFRMLRASRKLADKFIGPLTVVKAIGQNAYELDLPASFGTIHPTFHVSLLEPYRTRPGVEPPAPIAIDGGEEWEVEAVLAEAMKGKKRRYLVRWKGFSEAENSWEPEEHLVNAKERLQEFKNSQLEADHTNSTRGARKSQRGRPRK